ncbi:MAG: CYTH domain-containing protein [Nanoarchaeota archaeon]|nr:CYTH domain-containing protein [Nanoarchaeota archaeon]
MSNIEVEIRSFITKEQFENLLEFFKTNATLDKTDYQETYYFDCEQDLRIQKNNSGCKVWLKEGKIHDDHRKEIEIRLEGKDFEKLEDLFKSLGHGVQVKWFRERNQFDWNGIKVCLDYTKGYGYIIELEKMASEDNKQEILLELKQRLKELNVLETPKEEFKTKFDYYTNNWKSLTM